VAVAVTWTAHDGVMTDRRPKDQELWHGAEGGNGVGCINYLLPHLQVPPLAPHWQFWHVQSPIVMMMR